VLTYEGVYRAAFDGHGHFAFKGGIGIGPFGIRPTLMNVDWGVVAKYNGSWCPYYKNDRKKRCGV